jgi:hypothetical protein
VPIETLSARLLEYEARALLTRLAMVKPFTLQITMVNAAGAPEALDSIDRHLLQGRQNLARMVQRYIHWLTTRSVAEFNPADAQRKFSFLRVRFNAALTQFDIFADALCQRSEHDTGIWLAGLDVLAADALAIPGDFYQAPPVLCYLDRGVGAAIRRARTRLPGGGDNPVAIIRVPRERMVGSGIASSLVHEVGHQAAALLDLVDSMRAVLRSLQRGAAGPTAWTLYERWISEIIADFWSVARIGVGATLGLKGVVSLPRVFVFRSSLDDPHPMPWLRMKLSCAMGRVLYPHPQWDHIAGIWEAFYPRTGLNREIGDMVAMVEAQMPAFVDLLVHHRPKALRGQSLGEVVATPERSPAQLAKHWQTWRAQPSTMHATAPSLAFAVINQAKADGNLAPEEEGPMIAGLLRSWALRRALDKRAGLRQRAPYRGAQPFAIDRRQTTVPAS